MDVNIGFDIDLEKLVDTRMLITSNSGGGKSYALRVLLEQSHKHVMSIILDMEGEFKTLREKFDFLLVGKEGDVPINIKAAPLLAEKILGFNISTIIDLSDLKKHERITYVKKFLETLMQLPKKHWKPCLVVIGEAHNFCGQQEKQDSTWAVIDLMTRGRKRGYSGILETQRISKLHKDAAAECSNKLTGRIWLDIDMKRAGDELGMTSKRDMLVLRDLNQGEFYAFGVAFKPGYVHKVQVKQAETTHPRIGVELGKITPPTQRIKDILNKLSQLPEEVEKKRMETKEYQSEIRRLNAELVKERRVKPSMNPEALKNAEELAHQKGYGLAIRDNKQVTEQMLKDMNTYKKTIEQVITILNRVPEAKIQTVPKPTYNHPIIKEQPTTYTPQPPLHKEPVFVSEEFNESGVSAIQKRILTALAQFKTVDFNEVPRPMLAAFSNASPKSGHFSNSVSNLKTLGLVEYGSGTVKITEQGLDFIGEQDTPINDEELQSRWKNLLSALQKRIFEVLIEIYPDNISREDLAVRIMASPTSGHFSNSISSMKTMHALIYSNPGYVKASKNIFLGGNE